MWRVTWSVWCWWMLLQEYIFLFLGINFFKIFFEIVCFSFFDFWKHVLCFLANFVSFLASVSFLDILGVFFADFVHFLGVFHFVSPFSLTLWNCFSAYFVYFLACYIFCFHFLWHCGIVFRPFLSLFSLHILGHILCTFWLISSISWVCYIFCVCLLAFWVFHTWLFWLYLGRNTIFWSFFAFVIFFSWPFEYFILDFWPFFVLLGKNRRFFGHFLPFLFDKKSFFGICALFFFSNVVFSVLNRVLWTIF